jgi:aspartate ammonia-lyase
MMREHLSTAAHRTEHDSLGSLQVPEGVYYGISTLRAQRNFVLSGQTLESYPELIRAMAMVKRAAAVANVRCGILSEIKSDAIVKACNEIIAGQHHEQFPIDVFQGGAGTSSNMNINEVIANRGLILLGHPLGAYEFLNPHDDVNLSQSTNDVYGTAVRLAVLIKHKDLTRAIQSLADEFEARAIEFSSILKLGRTQLQDAIPMTLGQEFGAFSATLREDVARLDEAALHLSEINLGGTAIGSGVNANSDYAATVVGQLSLVSGITFQRASNLFEATWDMGAFVLYSGTLKRNATKLSKIANDLRLLASGPRGGLAEIVLPPMQPGSSIMPGKLNPVIPEAVNQVCFQVIGNDLVVTLAAEGGQLQLNPFGPIIAHNVLSSIKLLTNAATMLQSKCISGLAANEKNCQQHVEGSTSIAAAIVPLLGYEKAAAVAKEALNTNSTVREVVTKNRLLPEHVIDRIFDLRNLAENNQL